MKLMEHKILNYTNLYWEHKQLKKVRAEIPAHSISQV